MASRPPAPVESLRAETFLHLRHGVRRLARDPLVTVAIVLSLALGIGLNTVIFSFLEALFLRPIPAVPSSDRIAAIYSRDENGPGLLPISYLDYRDYTERMLSFRHLAARRIVSLGWAGVGETEQISGELVSANYFETLGLRPAAGRTFLPEEGRLSDLRSVVVLSHSLWQERFGGRLDAVGRDVHLNGMRFRIIGVAPEGFRGTDAFSVTRVWLPLPAFAVATGTPDLFEQRSRRSLLLFGLLRQGVSLEQAAGEMRILAAQIATEHPESHEGQTVELFRLPEALLYPSFRKSLLRTSTLLMIMAAILLITTCVNVANLLLARAVARHREWAVRLSLGAGRGHLARQLLVESGLLVLLGAACSLAVALWSWRLLWRYRPPYMEVDALQVSLDGRMLAFTLAISMITGLLFGLAPLRYALSSDLSFLFKEAPRASLSGRGRAPAENLFIAVQATFCTVSLACSGLFLGSLQAARSTDPGFAVEDLAMVSVDLRSRGYGEIQGKAVQEVIRSSFAAIPGVESVSLAENRLLGGFRLFREIRPWAEGAGATKGTLVGSSLVDAGYFATVGIPILRGRAFQASDLTGSAAVAVVNETLARRLLPGRNPIGQQLRIDEETEPVEIVGIARDAKYLNLQEASRPLLYLPLAQRYSAAVTVHLRTVPGAGATVLPAARQTMREVEPALPLLDAQTARDAITRSLSDLRMYAAILSVFGLLALTLTATGMYAVTAGAVARRNAEIASGWRSGPGATS